MTLVDTNVIMYAGGSAHPCQGPAVAFLDRVAAGAVSAAIDAELLQELLHRYRSLGRWDLGLRVYEITRHIFQSVLPVTGEVLDAARQLLDQDAALMTRDAVHAGVVRIYGLDSICSFDRDFDRIPGIYRIEPGA